MPDPTLNALRRKLEKRELEHLRRHVAELGERLEYAVEECTRARECAESWREDAMELIGELQGEGKTIGLTVDGQIGVVADRPAFACPELRDGEFYCGVSLEAGRPHHHLIGLPIELEAATWNEAIEQEDEDKVVPTRRELALARANAPEFFKPEWYWSCEQHASDADYAWYQYFGSGGQYYSGKASELRVRFFRRLPI